MDQTSPPPKAEDAAPFEATTSSNEPFEGDGRELAGVKGWRRSHRHLVYDALRIGFGRAPEENAAPKYLSVHGTSALASCALEKADALIRRRVRR